MYFVAFNGGRYQDVTSTMLPMTSQTRSHCIWRHKRSNYVLVITQSINCGGLRSQSESIYYTCSSCIRVRWLNNSSQKAQSKINNSLLKNCIKSIHHPKLKYENNSVDVDSILAAVDTILLYKNLTTIIYVGGELTCMVDTFVFYI